MLESVPRLGWVSEPTPIDEHATIAQELGLDWFGIKRDDECRPGHGGTKIRKLDVLLATEPFKSAPGWCSVGATGSGHLVALTAAAKQMDKTVHALSFWEPPSEDVLSNLAYTATGPTTIEYLDSRVWMALRHPLAVAGKGSLHGLPCIPPGGTTPAAVAGIVRGALELSEQIKSGVLPEPDKLVVALGTAGTAVGLSIGLALAGHKTRIIAVTVVEEWMSQALLIEKLTKDSLKWLVAHGVSEAAGLEVPPLFFHRKALGRGYGYPTEASLQAVERLRGQGVPIEAVYSGKAMGALLAREICKPGEKVLFWQTSRRLELEETEGWQDRLPSGLQRRLIEAGCFKADELESGKAPSWIAPPHRRAVLQAGLAAVGLGAVGTWRLGGYDKSLPWAGTVLNRGEAQVLAAAAEVLLHPVQEPEALPDLPAAVDRYLATLPARTRMEVHGLFGLVEHGGLGLRARLPRFTRMSPAARAAYLEWLGKRRGLLGLAWRGLRDLVVLGYYQNPATWPAMGYDGPLLGRTRHIEHNDYAALLAPKGSDPVGALR